MTGRVVRLPRETEKTQRSPRRLGRSMAEAARSLQLPARVSMPSSELALWECVVLWQACYPAVMRKAGL